MDGEDVMKGKVHKERREHWKGGSKRERERERERERKETEEKALGEESEHDHLYANPVSPGTPV